MKKLGDDGVPDCKIPPYDCVLLLFEGKIFLAAAKVADGKVLPLFKVAMPIPPGETPGAGTIVWIWISIPLSLGPLLDPHCNSLARLEVAPEPFSPFELAVLPRLAAAR